MHFFPVNAEYYNLRQDCSHVSSTSCSRILKTSAGHPKVFNKLKWFPI
jgi:hypothetical protein